MKTFKKIAALVIVATVTAALLTIFPSAAKTPVISLHPQSARFPEHCEIASWSCKCSNENNEYGPEFTREWYFFYNGMDFAAKNVLDNPSKYPFGDFDKNGSGLIGHTIMLANPGKGLDGVEIYCVVSSDGTHFAESERATIMIGDAATTPTPPDFLEVPAEITAKTGEKVKIQCKVNILAQGGHSFTWYEAQDTRLDGIKAILDAPDSDTYTVSHNKAGDYYYFLGVEVETADGKNSSYSYSSPIHVKVTASGGSSQEESGEALEVLSLPSKTTYFLGEQLKLKGLKVRYYTDMGFKDISDGKGMGYSPMSLTKFGQNAITLTYEGLQTTFYVTVEGAPAIPLIDSVSQGTEAEIGTPVKLTVNAHSTDSGTLTYLWYSTNVNDITTIMGIFDKESGIEENGQSFTVPQTEGTVYYAVAVWNNRAGGQSSPVYSDLIPVTYKKSASATGGDTQGTPSSGTPGVTGEANVTGGGKSDPKETTGIGSFPIRTVSIIVISALASALVIVLAMLLIARVDAAQKKK